MLCIKKIFFLRHWWILHQTYLLRFPQPTCGTYVCQQEQTLFKDLRHGYECKKKENLEKYERWASPPLCALPYTGSSLRAQSGYSPLGLIIQKGIIPPKKPLSQTSLIDSRMEEAEALVREAAMRNGRKLADAFKLEPVMVHTIAWKLFIKSNRGNICFFRTERWKRKAICLTFSRQRTWLKYTVLFY